VNGLGGFVIVKVTPAAANHFQLIVPATATAGTAFDVTVKALDPYGDVDTNYTGTITFTSSHALAVLPADYAFTAGDAGVHAFVAGITLITPGNQTMTVADMVDGSITGTATIMVNPSTLNPEDVQRSVRGGSAAAVAQPLMALPFDDEAFDPVFFDLRRGADYCTLSTLCGTSFLQPTSPRPATPEATAAVPAALSRPKPPSPVVERTLHAVCDRLFADFETIEFGDAAEANGRNPPITGFRKAAVSRCD
jgi:hypothetical protein